ncbi:MAG TPA: thermonuclease family protein [Alphaproteobacteria bacterium]
MIARLAACLVLALVATASAAHAAEITGPAHVIDASSIDIGGRPIRLYGIAAPAESQICERNGAAWRCGQDASWALAERLERHWVLCDTMDDAAPEASTAICYLGGRQGLDVAAWLVDQGWALADPAASDYAAQEQAAQKTGRGLWAGKFELPQLSQQP